MQITTRTLLFLERLSEKKSVKVHETTLKGIMGSFLLTSRFQGNFKKSYCKDDRLGIADWTYLFIYFFDALKFIDDLVPKWPFEIVACTFSFFLTTFLANSSTKVVLKGGNSLPPPPLLFLLLSRVGWEGGIKNLQRGTNRA